MKQNYLKSFCARFLTLLVLALMSTNLAWGATETIEVIGTLNLAATKVLGSTATVVNDYISLTANKNESTTAPTFNVNATNGTDFRMYKLSNGKSKYSNVTFSASDATISKIEFLNKSKEVLNSVSLTADCGTLSGGTWTSTTGVASVTFTNTDAFKEVIYGINVTYTYEGATKTLESIAISGTPTKTTYEAGEEFDPAGLTVTGTYDTGDPEVITSGIDWTITPNPLTAGTTSVSVTAKVGEITSAPYQVNGLTVKARTPYSFGFETATSLDWDFTNMESQKTHSEVTAHGGSYFGTTGGKATASMTTKSAVAKPGTLKCYVSKQSTNTASSTWKIQVSSDNSNWTDVKSQDATSMTKGKWVEFSADLSSYKDVYVRISYSGSTAERCIDDVSLTLAKDIVSIVVKTAPKATYNAKETFDPTGMVITATYDDASTKDITYDANDDKWSFSPSLETLLKGTDTKVDVAYGGKTAEQAITVNRLSAGLAVASETKDVVVNDMPNISEWYSVAEGYDGTVSVVSNNTNVFGIEGTTGLAYAAGTATLTITASQTDYYAGDSKNIEVTVSTEAVHYTVTWINKGAEYTEGNPTTDVIAGQKVETLPTAPTAIEGTAFMGWTAIETITDGEAPTDLFKTAEDAPTVDADVVYRAVYAQEGEGEPITAFALSNDAPADGDKVLIAGKNDSKYYAFSATTNAPTCNEITVTDNVVIKNSTTSGYVWAVSSETYSEKTGLGLTNSAGKLHFNNSAIKCATDFNNGIFEFSSSSNGFTMKGIVNNRWLTFNNNAFGVTSEETSASTIYIFKEAELPGEKIYTNYSFTNVAPIKDVTITSSVEEAETYWDAFTVTLACETTGTEIQYTLDGSDPKESETVYSGAINISGSNETITLRAIATDGNDNWSKEVTKEYTFGPIYSSLEDLAAADLESNTIVKVTFENVPIKSIFVTQQGYRNGIFFDIQKGEKDIEIYYQNVPNTWVAGGKVSGTMICPWTNYKGTWELAPAANSWNWSNLTYNAPESTEVTITDAKWATLGLPYAVTIPDGVSAYTATVSGTTVTMTKIKTGVIPADCGVILYADVNEATTYTFTETANVDPIEGNQLVAVTGETYTCSSEDEGLVYYLGKEGNSAVFKKLNENGTIAAGKAYLKLDEPLAEGAKLDVTFDEATGIKTIDNGQLTIDNSKVYNLNGVRVNENYKGIIIVNGKKYINK